MGRMRTVLLALVIGLLPAFGLLLPTAAQTTAIVVGEGAYSCDYAGLAAAISDVDAGGTVTFDCTETTIDFTATTGNITITKRVTIDGSNGGNPMTFDGNNATNMFVVPAGGQLTVQHLTFFDGNAPAAGEFDLSKGGAIDNDGGDITVLDSTFTGNTAETYSGAIDNTDNGTLTIRQSRFTGNTAGDFGGTIYNGGTLTVTQSNFTDNGAGEYGGTIYNGSTLTVTQSNFTDNGAVIGGGAIYNSGSAAVDRSSFVSNHAGGNGGGIYGESVTLTLTSSTLTGNTADYLGSAFYLEDSIFSSTTSIRWSTIVQPEGANQALYIGAPLTLEGVILAGPGDNCVLTPKGSTIDSYTLADDNSCGLDTSAAGTSIVDPDFAIGEAVTAPTIYGVEQTFYPVADGNPAINAGDSACPALDQVGFERPNGAACDIGAVEVHPPATTLEVSAVNPPSIDEGGTVDVKVHNSGDYFADITIDCDGAGPRPFTGTAPAWPDTTITLTCSYPDDASYTGSVGVIHDDLIVNPVDFTVSVTNAPPVITDVQVVPGTTVPVGQPLDLMAEATDVPVDELTFSFTCGAQQLSEPGEYSNDQFSAATQCTFDHAGQYQIMISATDDDGGTSEVKTVDVLVAELVNLCANRWSGDLRMPAYDRCASTELMLHIAPDSPATLCANRWTGEARYSPYDRCRSTETSYTADGTDSVPVCVNRWDGAVRISERCYSTERSDAL